jgi:hypothetical protein
MDIINFTSWLKEGRLVDIVDMNTSLVSIAIKDPRRDDAYLMCAMTVESLANQIGGGGSQDLQSVTDNGATTTNAIIVNDVTEKTTVSGISVKSEDTIANTFAQLNSFGSLALKNGNKISQLKNINVTNTDVILEFPNKATGSYTIATTSDLTNGTVTSVGLIAGTGISVSGGPITSSGSITVTNSAPDQVVAITAGTGIGVTGTYPNFTVTNSAPSSGGTVTSVNTTGLISGGPITSSGTITTSMSSNKLVGRSSSGVGIMEEISIGSGLTLSGSTLSATGGGTGYTYEIGQYLSAQGGVIFHRYIDNNVQYYLVVDTTDLSTSSIWSNVNSIIIGPTAQSTWNGSSNTTAITSQGGSSSGAAFLCDASSNGGQSDWYLPAIDELSLLFNNRFNVNRTLSGASSSGSIPGTPTQILYNFYWSSTEFTSNSAWYESFSDGSLGTGNKSDTFYVRAVRRFSV